MKNLALLAACCLVAAHAQPQVLRGRVYDQDTGESLPAATVQVEGTYRGTITNVDGVYELRVDALPATLLSRYIGYKTARVEVLKGDPGLVDIAMTQVLYEMGEIVVTGEDPAIAIMREVIERKKVWRAALSSYEALAYARFTLSNDSGIVSIRETATTAYWDRLLGMKEDFKGSRGTENIEVGVEMPAAEVVANLYDDDIGVGGHRLMGVTHPRALSLYHFRLQGMRRQDDAVVYDISVTPKSRLSSGFVGRVSVLGDAYAMINVELQPGEAFLFPEPIRRFNITFRQQFSSFGGDYWLPVDFRSEIEMEINFGGLLKFPTVRGALVARFTDYDVNIVVPEELFAADEYMRVDSAAVDTSTALDQAGLVVPLSPVEVAAYARIDSTMRMEDAFAPVGPLGRLARRIMQDDERDRSGPGGLLPGFLDAHPVLWFNRVDAFHGGIGLSVDAGPHLQLRGGGGWSSGLSDPDQWSHHAAARVRAGDDVQVFLEGRHEARTATRYASDHHYRVTNGIFSLESGTDYFDYYRSAGFTLTAGADLDKIDTELSALYRAEEHSSLPKTNDYDIFGSKKTQRDNPSIQEGHMQSVTLTVATGRRQDLLGFVGQRRVEIQMERSLPGSDFSFGRYRLVADWRQNTFGQRRLLPNTLDLRLVAGRSSGSLPLQRAFITESTNGGHGPFGALRSLTRLPYEGDHALALYWEHNFRTMFFEFVGLRSLAERGYSVLVFGGHAATWTNPASGGANTFERRESDGVHHELGVSFSGLLGLFRVNVARRLGDGAFTFSYGVARIF